MESGRPIIALWSAPRSRSTAFFRLMLERGDLLALHEPFCNVADHGETDVADELVRDHGQLITALRAQSRRRTVFFKDTTDNRYPRVLADREFLSQVRHTFLIRRPEEIAQSFYAVDNDMCCADIGLEAMTELLEATVAAGAGRPVVVDSQDLVDRPQQTVAAYCTAVGLPFHPEALRWRPGARTEWRRTAEWHTGVAASTGLHRRSTRYRHTPANTPLLARFSDHHRPFYERLHAARLRAPT